MSLISALFLTCCLLTECLQMVTPTELFYTIEEEVPVGTKIGNVAFDSKTGEGLSKEVRDSLRFKFLSSPSLNITIDEVSGDIRTNGRVDRDSLCRGNQDATGCQVRMNVAVHPVEHFRIIKVEITVIDINDNSPDFQPNRMVHEMIESTAVDSSFVVPTAKDADTTTNSVKRYELRDPDNHFVLNITRKLDGSSEIRVVLAKSLDRETKEEHRLAIIAFDAGRPPKSGSVDVTVVVLDSNDNIPVFDYGTYEVTIDENTPPGTTIAKVTAHDKDLDLNSQVLYFLSASTQSTFGNIFGVNNVTGEIFVLGVVDYERSPTYHLIVSAIDRGHDPVPSETNVIVKVEDVNDNAPMITVNSLFASNTNASDVFENAQSGTFVGHVRVHDPDRGRNGRFNCSISDTINFRLQKVQNSEYQLNTMTELDFEQTAQFSVVVRCSDHGRPSLLSEKELTVNIIDVNDNDPECSPELYQAELFENNYNGKVVVQLNCTDADSQQFSITSYQVSDEGQGRFAVDNNTGIVTATSSLDREDVAEHRFLVFAVDGGSPSRTGTATIVVAVLDVNDEKPVFTSDSFSFEVEENLPAGSFVGELVAKDLDYHPFDYFHFSLGPSSDAFFVNQRTGRITTTRSLDREEQDIYHVKSIVSDPNSPTMTSTAKVTIIVLDTNDHSPVFAFPTPGNNTVQVAGDTIEGQALARIQAQDSDERLNSEVSYLIVKGDDQRVFALDSVTGILKANVDFEYVSNNTFSLVVGATDRGAAPRRALAFLNVIVNRGVSRKDGFQAFVSFDRNSLVPILVVSGISAIVISVLLVAIFVVVCQQRARSKNGERKYNCRTEEALKTRQLQTLVDAGGLRDKAGSPDGEQKGSLRGLDGVNPVAAVVVPDSQTINSTVQVRLENGKAVSQCFPGCHEKQFGPGNLKPPDYYECYSDYSSSESLAAAAAATTLTRGYHVIRDVGEVAPSFVGPRTKHVISNDHEGAKSRGPNILGNTLTNRLRSCDGELSADVSSTDSGRLSSFNEESRDNMATTLLLSRRGSEMNAGLFSNVRRNQCPYNQSYSTNCPSTTLPRASSTTTALGSCYSNLSGFQRNRVVENGQNIGSPELTGPGTAYEITPSSSYQRFYLGLRSEGVRGQDGGQMYNNNHMTPTGSQINIIGSVGNNCLQ